MGLSLDMLRRHVPGYAGSFAAMVLAAALMSGSLSLAVGAVALDGVDVAAATPEDAARLKGVSQIMGSIGGLTAFVATLVSIVLIASTVSFVVQGRRRELAMLRLCGARPGQVLRLVTGEVAALSLVAGVCGTLFAVLIGRGYLAIFGATYDLPAGLTVNAHAAPLAAGVLLTVGVAVLAALAPARKVSRVQPIEALTEGSSRRRPMSVPRWALGVLAALVALGIQFVPADLPQEVFVWVVLGQGLMALLALVQLAPVVVAPVSRVVCGLIARVAPGPGTLAQGHSSWNAARTASLASPALLLVAVPGVFFTTFFGLSEAGAAVTLRTLHADAVVELPAGSVDVGTATAPIDGVDVLAPAFITTDDFWDISGSELEPHQLLATDLPALDRVVDLEVTGDLAAVHGTQVAVDATSERKIGDVVTLRGPQNREVDVTVVAVVGNAPVDREIMVDLKTFDLQGIDAEFRTWLLGFSDGVTADSATPAVQQALGGDARLMSAAGWSQGLTDAGNRQSTTSLLIMLGGSSLLCVLAIGVSIMTALRERQGEFALSRRAGAAPGAIQASTIIESLTVLVVAAVLAAGVIGAVWVRMLSNFNALDVGVAPPVPFAQLGWFALAGLAMALLATVGGTQWALRAIRLG